MSLVGPPPSGPGVTRGVHGGQTGSDRGGGDAFLALGLDVKGWCPKGRRAEDGKIPAKYVLMETRSRDYPDRTLRNVALADATAIFTWGDPEAGSRLTIANCLRMNKPYVHIDLMREITPCLRLASFLDEYDPRSLNVAGSCESQFTGHGNAPAHGRRDRRRRVERVQREQEEGGEGVSSGSDGCLVCGSTTNTLNDKGKCVDLSRCDLARKARYPSPNDKPIPPPLVPSKIVPPVGVYERIGTEVGKLVEEKNKAYGDSFAKCGDFLRLLYPSGIKPEQYGDALAQVRIFDKQMRIATDKGALGESPYRDIAGYGILGAAKDEREKKA